jgi:PAS domain S-box-containing protein
MAHARKSALLPSWSRRLVTPALICLGWTSLFAWVVAQLDGRNRVLATWLLLVPLCWTLVVCLLNHPAQLGGSDPPGEPGARRTRQPPRTPGAEEQPDSNLSVEDSMTGSGLYDTPSGVINLGDDGLVTGEFSIIDMINRLEPESFRWIDSSLAEQEFLGFVLNELKRRSFLEVVHPDDRRFAEQALRQVLASGEIHGVVVRVRTAQGKTKAVELNAGARYSAEHHVTYVRCHLTDVTEKVRAERQLRAMNQSLERANAELSAKNRELDEFVYVVSHDLQEPLRTLTAFSDFLLRDHGEQLDQEANEYVRHLVDASQRMKSMIGALLRLSMAGKVTDEFAPVELADLVAVVRTDFGALIRDRGAEVRLLDPHVTLWGDRRRLQQLLANLVSNGIKYNRSPVPTVEIGLFKSGGEGANPGAGAIPMQTILVRDNGIGIDPRHHRRIFQLFRRLHSQEEFEGSGVGLTICSKIVQAHGGEICLESEPGKGTTFYFSLPRGPIPSPAECGLAAVPQNPATAG